MGTSPSYRPKIAIFASGTGSNAHALLKHARALDALAQIKAIVTDNPNARVLKHAQDFNVEGVVIPLEKLPGEQHATAKARQEQRMTTLLQQLEVDWVLLAGYMRILSADFLSKFYNAKAGVNQVVNIHPSALPAFPGKDGYGDAFTAGVSQSGVTIHFVDAGVDTGPIIMQKSFARFQEDTLENFRARGLAIEHALYPQVLEQILNGTIFPKGKI